MAFALLFCAVPLPAAFAQIPVDLSLKIKKRGLKPLSFFRYKC
jgi:hypothetical protein